MRLCAMRFGTSTYESWRGFIRGTNDQRRTMSWRLYRRGVLRPVLFLLFLPKNSMADSAIDNPAAGGNENGRAEIEEITVTATKRTENVERVPIAVTVITADQLQARHAYDPAQLPLLAPGVQLQGNSSAIGATNFFIRGVGTAVFGVALEPSVSTVIDDVVMGRPEMGVVHFYDVDHIEVLRGPQGMLFGINASAGVINIVTTKPEIGRFSATAHVSYGRTDDATAGNEILSQAALNLPVSADSAIRVSAFENHDDGVVKNIFRPDEDLGFTEGGVKVKYLWSPGEPWEVLLAADYAQEHGAYDSFYTRRFDAPGGFIQAQDAKAGIVASPDNLHIASNGPTFARFQVGGAQATANYTFGDGMTLTNIAAVRGYNSHSGVDGDQLPIAFFDTALPDVFEHEVTDELRLTSPSHGAFTYQLGIFYMNLHSSAQTVLCANLEPLLPPPPPGKCFTGANNDERVTRENTAIYGQAAYSLNESLRFIAGGRFTSDHFRDHYTNVLGADEVPVEKLGDVTSRISNTNFSYRVGSEYDVTTNVLTYVTYARGYKGPAFDASTFATIRPEIPTDLEIGLKSTLLDRRLVLNVDVYRENFHDYQAQAFVLTAGTASFEITNIGTLRAQGVEADFTAIPFLGLSLGGAVAFNDAVFEDYVGAPCYFLEPTGTSGRNVCLPNGTTNVSGNPLNLAPRWTGMLTASYQHSVSAHLNGFIDLNSYYRSAMHFDATLDPQQRVGGLGLFGGSVGIASDDSHWRVSAYVRNAFNKHFPIQIRPDALATASGDASKGGDYWQDFDQSAFRTIGVSLDYRL